MKTRNVFLNTWGCLFCVLFANMVSADPSFSLSEEKDGKEGVLTITNKAYVAELRPGSGAVISSLEYGSSAKTELTHWKKGIRGGLVMERRTAGAEFEEGMRDVGKDSIRLSFYTRSNDLVVRKMFQFDRGKCAIRVELVFENHSALPLTGFAAPAISNVLGGTKGDQSRNSYYCLSRNGRPKIVDASSALRKLNENQTRGGKCQWIAVTDSARQYGMGIIFRDSAQDCPAVRRNLMGDRVIDWKYKTVPPWSVLTTRFLIVPFEGFAAVSEMNEWFIADTILAEAENGSARTQFNFMPLEQSMEGISVVTRAYNEEGEEIQPFEPLLFDEVSPREVVSDYLAFAEDEPLPAWLLHEVYVDGEKLGEFLGQVDGGGKPPERQAEDLEQPAIHQLDNGTDGTENHNQGAQDPVFEIIKDRSFEENRGKLTDRFNISLAQGERETIFWTIRAEDTIDRLDVSIIGADVPEDADYTRLPTSESYLWEIEPHEGHDIMKPFSSTSLEKGETCEVGLTIDSSELGAGRFVSTLAVTANGEKRELFFYTTVWDVDLPSQESFAIWHDTSYGVAGDRRNMSSFGVDGVICHLGNQKMEGDSSVVGIFEEAINWGYSQTVFSAPGSTLSAVSRLTGVTFPDDMDLAAGRPAWQVWASVDSPEIVQLAQEKDFSIALLTSRLIGDWKETIWGKVSPDYWMLEGGCPIGVMPALIEAELASPNSSVWHVMDIRNADWQTLAVWGRRALWAAAWQGLAGSVVRDGRGHQTPDNDTAVWHIMRDIRDEASLCAALLMEAEKLKTLDLDSKKNNLERIRILDKVEKVIGDNEDCAIRVREVLRGTQTVPRAYASLPKDTKLSIEGYRVAKTEILKLLEAAQFFADYTQQKDTFYRSADGVR